MKERNQIFYHMAIKNSYPNATNIRKPNIIGIVAPVFLADIDNDTVVCKFGPREMIFHNKIISRLLENSDINAPRTHIHSYMDTWFESYKYNTTKTLHELIQEGLSEQHIFNAYCSVFEIQNKISQISPDVFNIKYFHNYKKTLEAQQEQTDNKILQFYRELFRGMSATGKQILLHNDIHDKNILYCPETQQSFLIDLDAVSLCNENFTMLTTLQRYPLDNYYELMHVYEQKTGRHIDCRRIMLAKSVMEMLRTIKEKAISLRQK